MRWQIADVQRPCLSGLTLFPANYRQSYPCTCSNDTSTYKAKNDATLFPALILLCIKGHLCRIGGPFEGKGYNAELVFDRDYWKGIQEKRNLHNVVPFGNQTLDILVGIDLITFNAESLNGGFLDRGNGGRTKFNVVEFEGELLFLLIERIEIVGKM